MKERTLYHVYSNVWKASRENMLEMHIYLLKAFTYLAYEILQHYFLQNREYMTTTWCRKNTDAALC